LNKNKKNIFSLSETILEGSDLVLNMIKPATGIKSIKIFNFKNLIKPGGTFTTTNSNE
jgi:hypothetical protein